MTPRAGMRPRAYILAAGTVMAVWLTACSGDSADSASPTELGSDLPIATASEQRPPTPPPLPSPSASMPVWDDPEDPVAAYHELIDKIAYMRAHPSTEIFHDIYVPKSRIAGTRTQLNRMIRLGTRLVEGRTVVESVEVISQDNNTVFLEVHGREEGWVSVDADGNRSEVPTQCEQFVVEMRDQGDGWRLATLIGDKNKSFWRC